MKVGRPSGSLVPLSVKRCDYEGKAILLGVDENHSSASRLFNDHKSLKIDALEAISQKSFNYKSLVEKITVPSTAHTMNQSISSTYFKK